MPKESADDHKTIRARLEKPVGAEMGITHPVAEARPVARER
jgi:hypothetical protein